MIKDIKDFNFRALSFDSCSNCKNSFLQDDDNHGYDVECQVFETNKCKDYSTFQDNYDKKTTHVNDYSICDLFEE